MKGVAADRIQPVGIQLSEGRAPRLRGARPVRPGRGGGRQRPTRSRATSWSAAGSGSSALNAGGDPALHHQRRLGRRHGDRRRDVQADQDREGRPLSLGRGGAAHDGGQDTGRTRRRCGAVRIDPSRAATPAGLHGGLQVHPSGSARGVDPGRGSSLSRHGPRGSRIAGRTRGAVGRARCAPSWPLRGRRRPRRIRRSYCPRVRPHPARRPSDAARAWTPSCARRSSSWALLATWPAVGRPARPRRPRNLLPAAAHGRREGRRGSGLADPQAAGRRLRGVRLRLRIRRSRAHPRLRRHAPRPADRAGAGRHLPGREGRVPPRAGLPRGSRLRTALRLRGAICRPVGAAGDPGRPAERPRRRCRAADHRRRHRDGHRLDPGDQPVDPDRGPRGGARKLGFAGRQCRPQGRGQARPLRASDPGRARSPGAGSSG